MCRVSLSFERSDERVVRRFVASRRSVGRSSAFRRRCLESGSIPSPSPHDTSRVESSRSRLSPVSERYPHTKTPAREAEESIPDETHNSSLSFASLFSTNPHLAITYHLASPVSPILPTSAIRLVHLVRLPPRFASFRLVRHGRLGPSLSSSGHWSFSFLSFHHPGPSPSLFPSRRSH